MSIPPFPLVGVHLHGMAASEAIKMFLDQRPDERWVLLGEHAAQGDDQLWTAWIQATRNELRGTMVARTVDAEFLRYLAGTHHISEAFARAGVKDGQENAWILHLPLAIVHNMLFYSLYPEQDSLYLPEKYDHLLQMCNLLYY